MIHKIYGPPGTGKTHRLINRARAYVKIGTPLHKIGYFAFTRKAAKEARERMPIDEKKLEHFQTLHSFAYNTLGLNEENIMQPFHYEDLGKELGIRVKYSDKYNEEETHFLTCNDPYFQMIGRAINRDVGIREEFDRNEHDRKQISYEVQGGVKNYLGKQKEVTAPVKWKSSPDHPETELAYITKAEKDLLVKKDLHGSLKGDVNRGPSGIMSLDGYGSIEDGVDVGMSGAATSAAESGGGSGADARELAAESSRVRSDLGFAQLPPGVIDQNIQDYRNAFIAAGGGQRVNPGFFDSRNVVSPDELARARAYNPAAFKAGRRGGIMDFFTGGGFLGNIIRGLGQKFGLGKRFDEPTYDMRRFSSVNPTFQNDLDNEGLLSLIGTGGTTNTVPFDATTFDDDVNLMNTKPSGGTILYDEFIPGMKNDDSVPLPRTLDLGNNKLLMADAAKDQNKEILENLFNPALNFDEAIDKDEKKKKRQQELLEELMLT